MCKLRRSQRVACGISIRAMAKILGISASYLVDLEKGHRPFSPFLHARYMAALKTQRSV